MKVQIDLVEALRCDIYRKEISEELESDITDMVMLEAADEIESLRKMAKSAAEAFISHYYRFENDDALPSEIVSAMQRQFRGS